MKRSLAVAAVALFALSSCGESESDRLQRERVQSFGETYYECTNKPPQLSESEIASNMTWSERCENEHRYSSYGPEGVTVQSAAIEDGWFTPPTAVFVIRNETGDRITAIEFNVRFINAASATPETLNITGSFQTGELLNPPQYTYSMPALAPGQTHRFEIVLPRAKESSEEFSYTVGNLTLIRLSPPPRRPS